MTRAAIKQVESLTFHERDCPGFWAYCQAHNYRIGLRHSTPLHYYGVVYDRDEFNRGEYTNILASALELTIPETLAKLYESLRRRNAAEQDALRPEFV